MQFHRPAAATPIEREVPGRCGWPHGGPAAASRAQLPIYEHRAAILHAIESHGVTIVVGETGSGKSTQIPQFVHEAGWTRDGMLVCCTQPRRVAAVSLATRVAEEMGVEVGREVGYEVRFESACSTRTRVMYLTDGMLLRQLLIDPLLSSYSVVMLDEAHERGLNTDLLCGLLRRVRTVRPELRLVIASATLEADKFARFFDSRGPPPAVPKGVDVQGSAGMARGPAVGLEHLLELPDDDAGIVTDATAPTGSWAGKREAAVEGGGGPAKRARASRWGASTQDNAPAAEPDVAVDLRASCVLAVQGRCFPVEVQYAAEAVRDYVDASAAAVLAIHSAEGPGDVLVFLAGAEEIDTCCAAVREGCPEDAPPLDVFPLHASLSHEAQLAALEPGRFGRDGAAIRKVIVATNIAETSITLEGVVFVVDAGFVKSPFAEPRTGIASLLTAPVSQAGAAQRAGRAGRVQRGKCVRLYTEAAFRALSVRSAPEVLRTDLAPALLTLAALGVRDAARFPWLDAPAPEAVIRALDTLHALRAIDSRGALLQPWGPALADLPVAPRLGGALLASLSLGCADEVLTMVAMAEVAHALPAYGGGTRGRAASAAYEASLRAFGAREGDHLTLLNVFNGYEGARRSSQWASSNGFNPSALAKAAEVRGQLRSALAALCRRARARRAEAGLPPALEGEEADAALEAARGGASTPLASTLASPNPAWSLLPGWDVAVDASASAPRQALAAGLFFNAARLGNDGSYITMRGGQRASLAPGSVFSRLGVAPPEWVVFDEADWAGGELILRIVTAISPLWLLDVAPHAYEAKGELGAGLAGGAGSYLSELKGASIPPPPTNVALGGGGRGEGRLVYKSAAERKREAEAAKAPPAPAPVEAARPVAVAKPGGGLGVAAMLGSLFEQQDRASAAEAAAAAAAARSALGRTGGLGRGGHASADTRPRGEGW
jgi:ATP-dependent RNA helicase DDX35